MNLFLRKPLNVLSLRLSRERFLEKPFFFVQYIVSVGANVPEFLVLATGPVDLQDIHPIMSSQSEESSPKKGRWPNGAPRSS